MEIFEQFRTPEDFFLPQHQKFKVTKYIMCHLNLILSTLQLMLSFGLLKLTVTNNMIVMAIVVIKLKFIILVKLM